MKMLLVIFTFPWFWEGISQGWLTGEEHSLVLLSLLQVYDFTHKAVEGL